MAFILIFFTAYSFGDRLYRNGDYFRAITEYKRDLFLNEDSLNAIHKIGMAYFELGKYEDALRWFSRAYYEDSCYKFKYEYLLTKLEKFEDAQILFSLGNTGKKEKKLRNLVDFVQEERNYWKLSYIVPGSGQILSGQIRSGLMSFILNFGAAYLVHRRVEEKDIAGSIFSFSHFLGFYIGNIQAAKKSEERRRKREFHDKISDLEGEYLY